MEKGKDIKKDGFKTRIFILIGIIVVVILILIGIGIWLYNSQYNSKGVSHFLVVEVEQEKERVQIGGLDGYNVYVEGLSKYNFRTFGAKNVSLEEALEKELVSIDEWKKYALSTKKDNDSLILVFENYEISLTGDECLIRPRS